MTPMVDDNPAAAATETTLSKQQHPPQEPTSHLHLLSDTEIEFKPRHSRKSSRANIDMSMTNTPTALLTVKQDVRGPLSDTEMDYTTPLNQSEPKSSSGLSQQKNGGQKSPSTTVVQEQSPVNQTIPDLRELGQVPFELALCKNGWLKKVSFEI